jgi:hypothetical protein
MARHPKNAVRNVPLFTSIEVSLFLLCYCRGLTCVGLGLANVMAWDMALSPNQLTAGLRGGPSSAA